jgi:hypothetical protein
MGKTTRPSDVATFMSLNQAIAAKSTECLRPLPSGVAYDFPFVKDVMTISAQLLLSKTFVSRGLGHGDKAP